MAPKQKLKKVTRKRREKKLVERGAAQLERRLAYWQPGSFIYLVALCQQLA